MKSYNRWYLIPLISLILTVSVHIEWIQFIFIRVSVYGSLVILMRHFLNKEHNEQKEFDINSFKSLYGWSDYLDGGQLFISELLEKHSVEKDILSNLKKIKSEILIACNHELKNLRLLEAYFKVLQEDKEKEFYYKSVLGLLVSVGIFLLRQILLGANIPATLNNFLSNIYFYDFLFIFFISFAYMSNLIYLGNRRIKIFHGIITQCIEEKK